MCRIESSPFAEVRLKQRNLIESHGEAIQDEKQNMALELLRRIVEARKWGVSRTRLPAAREQEFPARKKVQRRVFGVQKFRLR